MLSHYPLLTPATQLWRHFLYVSQLHTLTVCYTKESAKEDEFQVVIYTQEIKY